MSCRLKTGREIWITCMKGSHCAERMDNTCFVLWNHLQISLMWKHSISRQLFKAHFMFVRSYLGLILFFMNILIHFCQTSNKMLLYVFEVCFARGQNVLCVVCGKKVHI